MDCSLPGFSVHGIFQARVLEWGAIAFSMNPYQIRSDQISHSVVSDSLQPHESQHVRPPCPSPIPRVHPDCCLVSILSIESVIPSSHLILCWPLLLLPPIPPSIRVFSNESTLRMRWPKYWSFSLKASSKQHPLTHPSSICGVLTVCQALL